MEIFETINFQQAAKMRMTYFRMLFAHSKIFLLNHKRFKAESDFDFISLDAIVPVGNVDSSNLCDTFLLNHQRFKVESDFDFISLDAIVPVGNVDSSNLCDTPCNRVVHTKSAD